MRALRILLPSLFLLLLIDVASAQDRPASPRGEAAVQLGDNWIVVDYGRPILRGRSDIFGAGDTYGEKVTGGAPVWRAGANQTTQFMTETALQFGDQALAAGTYTLFVELAGGEWTLVLSNHVAKSSYRAEGDGLWGAYNYTADKDVVRVSMEVSEHGPSVEQFTIGFVDVSENAGTLTLSWANTTAAAGFSF